MFINIALLAVASVVIWLATEIVISAVGKLTSHTRLSKFTLSLVVIGFVTSLPEVAVTVNSLALNSPQIAIGNLIGSQIFLLFLVIPVLAIVKTGLKVHPQMKNISLVLTLLVTAIPIVALLNQRIDLGEVLIIIGAYVVFALTFFRNSSLKQRAVPSQKTVFGLEILKLLAGLGVLFLASHTAVKLLIEISASFGTPRFLLSLLILPIATNLAEITMALKHDFSLTDYLGALTFNSLLIAVLVLLSGGSLAIGQNISLVVLVFMAGLGIFWWCCHSKEQLSSKESLLLFLVYLGVLLTAAWQIMNVILH